MIEFNIENLDWKKTDGLIPAIIQDNNTGKVLMLGYMNQEALQQTLQTNKVTFFSRTKNALWVKGETSGNFLEMVTISSDCDNDTLLILAKPCGPTCHTGDNTCFKNTTGNWSILTDIEATIKSRAESKAEDSYTVTMLNKGLNKIAQKVGEEGVETVIAGLNESDERLFNEAADLLYHLQLLLFARNCSIEDVFDTLLSRIK